MIAIRISVIIPTYNHGQYLMEAIRSVESLGDPSVEIIVVDDGSTDPESQRVSNQLLAEGYQVYIRTNKGVAASRNFGIRQAKGRYIIPLDADNRLLAPYLQEGAAILDREPSAAVVFGDALIFGEKGGTWVNHPLELKEIVFENYIDNCAIIRKEAWESVGGYDENAPFHTREDWFFWLALLGRDWKFHYLHAFCFEYRFLQNSKVRSRYALMKNRLIINQYIFPVQDQLIGMLLSKGEITEGTAMEIRSRLLSQLGHYHFLAGNPFQGYSLLFKSLKNGLPVSQFLNQCFGWPVRRWKARSPQAGS